VAIAGRERKENIDIGKIFVFVLSDPCPPLPEMPAHEINAVSGVGRRVSVLSGK